jgi:hypothetical protein
MIPEKALLIFNHYYLDLRRTYCLKIQITLNTGNLY